MRRHFMTTVGCCLIGISMARAQSGLQFDQLPAEIRTHAIETREACRALNPDRTFDDMQGIQVLSLDGARGIFVDDEGLCGEHIAGGNCSNRGCDLTIYKEVARGRWQKIFKEHLYDRHLAIDWEDMRFQLMFASIYAGDPRCKPPPNKEYTSGHSCNLIVTYRNGRWNWERIR